MSERLVQWLGKDSGFKVGRVVEVEGEEIVKRARSAFRPYTWLLVRHSHTGELEWVSEQALSTYPSEPIPQP